MTFGILFMCWVLGATATLGAISSMGMRNPNTIGDCFSGDYQLDLIIGIIWPVFWPCFVAHWLAIRLSGGRQC